MPTEFSGPAYLLEGQRDSVLLRHIFERFVARFLHRHLLPIGWQVKIQKYLKWPVDDFTGGINEHLPSMQVDMLLTNPSQDRQVILDTKFTDILTQGKSGRQVFKSPHLYQLYTYIRSQEASLPNCREGLLLYPAVGRDFRESARLQGIVLRLETVNLAKPWAEIERSLLALFH
jgi:5-methylcytosine-specific restriction enzyme subunit McrC